MTGPLTVTTYNLKPDVSVVFSGNQYSSSNQAGFASWVAGYESGYTGVIYASSSRQSFGTINVTPSVILFGAPHFSYDASANTITSTQASGGGIVANSPNADSFFAQLGDASSSMQDMGKLGVLAAIGHRLYRKYDMNAYDSNTHMSISEDNMLNGLRDDSYTALPGLLCGNIATFQVKSARSMDMRAWLQTGGVGDSKGVGAHAFAALELKDASGKPQIAFLDSDNSVFTGTRDYRKALGIAEQYHGYASMDAYVANPDAKALPVDSQASSLKKYAAGAGQEKDRLADGLSRGRFEKPERSIRYRTTDEDTELRITGSTYSLMLYSYSEKERNDYMSLKNADAISGRFGLYDNGNFRLHANATLINSTMKALDGTDGQIWHDLVPMVAADYVNGRRFNSRSYGSFEVNFGATMGAAASFLAGKSPLDEHKSGISMSGNVSAGARLAYISPTEKASFYVSPTVAMVNTASDMQAQAIAAKFIEQAVTVGTTVEVRNVRFRVEGEVRKSDLETRTRGTVSANAGKNSVSLNAETSTANPDYPLVNSSSAKIDYTRKLGPVAELIIYGNKKKEGDGREEYVAGALVRMPIWN